MKLINIKNIVIWTLVLLNLFFLAFYLIGVYNDKARKEQALDDLAALLEQNGIAFDPENIREAGLLPEYTTNRDPDGEQKLAQALLGPVVRLDEGGNIFVYKGEGENGQAKFISGGAFDAALKPGAIPSGGDAAAAAEELLNTLQIETYSITANAIDGIETVTAVCAVGGRPIFNCRIDMRFEKDSLVLIRGKLAADMTETAGRTDMSSPATALMIFLAGVKSGDISCARIDSVQAGYTLADTNNPDYGALVPVWEIKTNSGVYHVNTVTRKTEQSIE